MYGLGKIYKYYNFDELDKLISKIFSFYNLSVSNIKSKDLIAEQSVDYQEGENSLSIKYQYNGFTLDLNVAVIAVTQSGGKRNKGASKYTIKFQKIKSLSIDNNGLKYTINGKEPYMTPIFFISPDGNERELKPVPEKFDKDYFDKYIGFIKEMLNNTEDNAIAADFFEFIVCELFNRYEKKYLSKFIRVCKQFKQINNLDRAILNKINQLFMLFWNIRMDEDNPMLFHGPEINEYRREYALVDLLTIKPDGSYHISTPFRNNSEYGFDIKLDSNNDISSVCIGGEGYDSVLLEKEPFRFQLLETAQLFIAFQYDYFPHRILFEENHILIDSKSHNYKFELKKVGDTFYLTNSFSWDNLNAVFPAITGVMKKLHLNIGESIQFENYPIKDETAKELYSSLLTSAYIQSRVVRRVSSFCEKNNSTDRVIQLFQTLGFEYSQDNLSYIDLCSKLEMKPNLTYVGGEVSQIKLADSWRNPSYEIKMVQLNGVSLVAIYYKPFTFQIKKENGTWEISFETPNKPNKRVVKTTNIVPSVLSSQSFMKIFGYVLKNIDSSEYDAEESQKIFDLMADILPSEFREEIYGLISPEKIEEQLRVNDILQNIQQTLNDKVIVELDSRGYKIKAKDQRKQRGSITVGHNLLEIRYRDKTGCNYALDISFFEDYPSIRIVTNDATLNINFRGDKYTCYYYSLYTYSGQCNSNDNEVLEYGKRIAPKADGGRVQFSLEEGSAKAYDTINSSIIDTWSLKIIRDIMEYFGITSAQTDQNDKKAEELYLSLLELSGIANKVCERLQSKGVAPSLVLSEAEKNS